MGLGSNEAGTLSHSPADASNDLSPPTPAHVTNEHTDTSVWVRCDKNPSVLRTTLQRGPEWKSVSRRVSIIVNPERPDLRCDVVDDLRDAGNITDVATLYKRIDARDGDLLLTVLFSDDKKDRLRITNSNQSFPTTINELTGSADQESVVGGAYGASQTGTEGTPCTAETDYWILFPERFESALCKEIRSKGIGMDVVHINTLKDKYNGYLDLVKKHRVNLLIELPPVTSNEDLSQRHRKHLSRVQKMASVAG